MTTRAHHNKRPAGVLCASLACGTLAFGATVAPAMADGAQAGAGLSAKAPGQLQIRLSGLPESGGMVASAQVKVVGPAGAKKMRTWVVKGAKTIRGLVPGLYAVDAHRVRTTSGEDLEAATPARWIRVGKERVAKVKVNYGAPYKETGYENYDKKNLDAACQWMYGFRAANSAYRTKTDPFSIYCLIGSRELGGVDLYRFCRFVHDKGAYGAHTELLGNTVEDWYCIYHKD